MKYPVCCVVLLLLSTSLAGCASDDEVIDETARIDIENLESELLMITSDIETLQSANSQLNSENDALQSYLDSIVLDLTQVKVNITLQVNSLNHEISQNTNAISELQSENADLATQLTQLDSDQTEMYAQLSSQIADNAQQIADHGELIAESHDHIQGLLVTVSTIQSILDSHQGALFDAASRLDILEDGVDLSLLANTDGRLILTCADLHFADFSNHDLSESYFYGADVRYSDFSYSDLSYSNFSYHGYCHGESHESEAQYFLTKTILLGSNFSHADLSNTDMRAVIADHGDFSYADFSYSDISNSLEAMYANSDGLLYTSFYGANLTGTDFSYADLTGADLDDAILDNAIWYWTTCPDGTNTGPGGWCT